MDNGKENPRKASAKYLRELARIDYEDTFEQACSEQVTLQSVFAAFGHASPGWVRALMWLRGLLVAPFGLKHSSTPLKQRGNLKEGDKLGFIEVGPVTENSILLGADDSHLDFRAYIKVQDCLLSCKTTVKFNSNFGRVYFALVKPFHRIIIPNLLKNIIRLTKYNESGT